MPTNPPKYDRKRRNPPATQVEEYIEQGEEVPGVRRSPKVTKKRR